MTGHTIAEESLLTRAREGDVRAYEELVERHQGTAFRVAWLITRFRADAEEAAQDAFLKAYRSLGGFRAGAPFRPWLLRIVANEARNRRVAVGRRERLALRLHEERPPAFAGAAEAETAATLGVRRGTVKSRLSRALGRLRKEMELDG